MSDFQFKDFEDYLEQLSVENKDVAHTSNGQVCFSRLRSAEEVNQIINNAGKNIVLLGRFSGRAIGELQEQGMRQFAVIRFACFAENNDGDISDGIDNAIQQAWDIMWQFVARMRKDQKDDDCGPLDGVELENISWDEIDEPIYLEHHYGWDLTLPFRSMQPMYDADKWN